MKEPRTWLVIGVVILEALSWSVLSMLLAMHGHSPSGPPLLPIEPADYYGAQVWFAPAVVLCAFGAQTLVVRSLMRATWKPATTIAGVGVSVPILVLWVCGDLVAYTIGGFSALTAAVRITVPLALLGVLALVAVLAKRRNVGTKRALLVAACVLVTRGLLFGPFMR